MGSKPYGSAKRGFWLVDNGSPHAGRASIERLEGEWKNLRLIHLPVHASCADLERVLDLVDAQAA